MDTSEKYIEMCEKAYDEIQRDHKYNWGDYWSETVNDKSVGVHRYPITPKFICDVWLPTQDQLQEMLGFPLKEDRGQLYEVGLIDLFVSFTFDWHYEEYQSDIKDFTSMEQIWLAMFMKEKHHKIWKDGDWVKQCPRCHRLEIKKVTGVGAPKDTEVCMNCGEVV